MIPRWTTLDSHDRYRFSAAVAFVTERLEGYDTIEWALSLKGDRLVERIAIDHAVNESGASALTEPLVQRLALDSGELVRECRRR